MRIKKVSQTIPTSAQIVDGYAESSTDGYSCDYINGLNTYSTTETRIGTFFGKPLYSKSFKILPDASYVIEASNLLNDISVDEVMIDYSKTILVRSSGWSINGVNIGDMNNSSFVAYQVNKSGTVQVYQGSNLKNSNTLYAIITLLYTKTTD